MINLFIKRGAMDFIDILHSFFNLMGILFLYSIFTAFEQISFFLL
jgi:hypothetical protein